MNGKSENCSGVHREKIDSPIGPIQIEADPSRLISVLFETQDPKFHQWPENPNEITRRVAAEIGEYFAGRRTRFTTPLKLSGTEFQKQAWSALLEIPYGKTSTYGRQAAAIGRPKSVRAIGAANGKNRIGIIVPCHRVIGANGTLTGYGGGIERKRWLLEHERSQSRNRCRRHHGN